MKNFYLSIFLVTIFISHSFSQNTFPSSGAVGIGTTNPTSILHVMGTTTNGYGLFLLQDNVQSAATARNYLTFADFTGLRMGYFGAVGDGNITLGSDNSRNIVLTGGNIGVGTTSPSTKIHVYGTLTIDPIGQSYNNYSEGIRVGAASNGYSIITFGVNTAVPYGAKSSQWWLGKDGSDNGFNICGITPGNAFHITPSGNVGIGTINPDARLHVNSLGTSLSPTSQFSGDMIIQGNPPSRSTTNGASLEFVIPANTDGSNPWGQARIIAVGGNAETYNATGKLVIGTRRMFDKGAGPGYWNYGDDLVIDGAGNVGIGTLTPREALSVNGTIRSKEVKVEAANWPDYVFKPAYHLPTLTEVKKYIDQNQHLPDMPPESEVNKYGISLGEMNMRLVKKVEELTLYLIDIKKENEVLKKGFNNQKNKLNSSLLRSSNISNYR